MCGIAGFFGHRSVAAATIDAMRSAIARRGPDAFHVAGSAQADSPFVRQENPSGLQRALLHARLSIRDPRPLAEIDQDLKACTDRIKQMIEGLSA
mgnify:CR=1 FL=1